MRRRAAAAAGAATGSAPLATDAAQAKAGPSALLRQPTLAGWWLGVAVLVRFVGAAVNGIADCDETFNYWEPTHYLLYGSGMQTWEYSPEFGSVLPLLAGARSRFGRPTPPRPSPACENQAALVLVRADPRGRGWLCQAVHVGQSGRVLHDPSLAGPRQRLL